MFKWNKPLSKRLSSREPCSVEEIESLLQAHPDQIKFAPRGGYLPLHSACSNPYAKLDTVRYLVKSYPEALQARNSQGYLPLHCACAYASLGVIQCVLDAWPEALMIPDEHSTPLFTALKNRRELPIIDFLLSRNPELLHVSNGRSPLHEAIIHGGYHGENLDVVKLLVELNPKDLQAKDFCGYLPLHWALDRSLPDVIDCVLEAWPAAVEIEAEGSSPLHKACSRILPLNLVQKIIDRNEAAVRVQDRNGQLPLHRAVSMSRAWDLDIPLGLIQVLLEKWPDAVAVKDNGGRLPLHTALLGACGSFASRGVLQLLVKAFPESAKVVDADGCTPARLACNHWDYVPYVVQWLAGGLSPLHVACGMHPSLDTIEKIVKKCPDGIRSLGDNGELPLHAACSADAESRILKFLIKKYPKAVTIPDKDGCLPLHLASKDAHWPSFRTIFYKNTLAASVANNDGDYPLHLACHRNADGHIVAVLFSRYPQALECRNKLGYCPVQLAYMNDSSVDVLYLLIRQLPTSIDELRELVVGQDVVYTERVLEQVKEFYEKHTEIETSHGIQHVMNVYYHAVKAVACHMPPLSSRIAMEIKVAALLHDVDDSKYFPHHVDNENAWYILQAAEIEDDSCTNIMYMIGLVSCSKNGNKVPESIVQSSDYHLLVPRWADRLEAVGAVGVVRCYQYNKEHHQPLSSPRSPRAQSEEQVWEFATPDRFDAYLTSGGSSDDMISHYYDKLLHIACPPKEIVHNSYLEERAQESSRELVEMCVRFGKTGVVDEDYIQEVAKKLG